MMGCAIWLWHGGVDDVGNLERSDFRFPRVLVICQTSGLYPLQEGIGVQSAGFLS